MSDDLPMDMILDLHARALTAMADLVTTTSPALLSCPTPCTEWDVQELLEHAVGLNRGFASALAAGSAPLDAYAPRPVTEWEDSALVLRDAARTVPLDRQVQVVVVHPTATFATTDVFRMHLLDLVVHAWDLAVSTDRHSEPEQDVVETLAPQVRLIAGLDRSGSVSAQFGPPQTQVASGETAWPDVLRLLGRDPAWPGARVDPCNSPRPS